MQWMQREEERGEPRSRDGETAQHEEEQKRGGRVQHEVDEMVAERGVAPEAVLEPERGMQERVILLRGSGRGPNQPQSVQRAERGRGHVRVVVPDEAGRGARGSKRKLWPTKSRPRATTASGHERVAWWGRTAWTEEAAISVNKKARLSSRAWREKPRARDQKPPLTPRVKVTPRLVELFSAA